MQNIDDLFSRLSRSAFRQKFSLKQADKDYFIQQGLEVILLQAQQMIRYRLGTAFPENDGRQTPFKGHPVFVAQHATATCCRGCLVKWHGIQKGHALTDGQIDYLVCVIRYWLMQQNIDDQPVRQGRLF